MHLRKFLAGGLITTFAGSTLAFAQAPAPAPAPEAIPSWQSQPPSGTAAWAQKPMFEPPSWVTPEARAAMMNPDQMEPINRKTFKLNNAIEDYFWEPAGRGLATIATPKARVGVRNFLSNLTTPLSAVNNGLQGKFPEAGSEFKRFGINTTVGILGFSDAAQNRYGIEARREDLGRTLGRWGMQTGPFMEFPVAGRANPRDLGAGALMAVVTSGGTLVVWGVNKLNNTSLDEGAQQAERRSLPDPYATLRDRYMTERVVKKPQQ